MVDVVHEAVQRPHALPQAALQLIHSSRRDDARDEVERNQPLGAVLFAVDGEGDADAVEQRIRLGALLRQPLRRLLAQPARIAQVVGASSTLG